MYTPRTSLPDVSRTALGICAYCALIERHQDLRTLFYDPFAPNLFRAASPDGDRVLDRMTDWPTIEASTDELGAMRSLCHVAWRKRWVSDEARKGLENGATQVVILGAGLDTLPLRLGPAYPDVTFFEVDQPATIAAKKALVARLFGAPPTVRYTAVDFATERFEDRLGDLGFDPAQQTVFIAEVSLARRLEATAEDIVSTMHAHPTMHEAIHEAALAAEGRLIHG